MLLLPGAAPPSSTHMPCCLLAARLSSFVCILGGPVNQRANEHVTQAQPIRFSPEILMQVLFSSVTQLCPTLCDPMDCSTPGFLVHHQFLELAQTHVHQVGDAIQPSYPLSSPSPPALNLSQHQGLFQ